MVKSPAFTELSLVAQYRVPNPIVKKRAPTTCTTQPIQSNPTRQFIPCPCHHTNSRTMKQSDSVGYGIIIPGSSHLDCMRKKSRSIIHFPKRFALSTLFKITSSFQFRLSCLCTIRGQNLYYFSCYFRYLLNKKSS